MIVHIAAADALSRWTRNAPAFAIVLADAFWPGPLTLILARANGVSDLLTGGQDSIGLRVPAHPIARALLARFVEIGGDGIAAPSANRFGRISATSRPRTSRMILDPPVEVILDGGPCEHGIESTIVSCTRDHPSVLRPGAISVDQLAHVLGSTGCIKRRRPAASGTLAAHYAPRTSSRMLHRDALPRRARQARAARRIHRSARPLITQPPDFEGTWFDAPPDSAGYAHQLYANLRALDARQADEIWIETPPDGPDWTAINDRLRRATHRD